MKLIIDIPESMYEGVMIDRVLDTTVIRILNEIKNGTPLPKYTEELKRRLFMEVDGGTDDKYLRYADVCDRISNTIDTYIKAESEDKE